jgi:hypothetical protein
VLVLDYFIQSAPREVVNEHVDRLGLRNKINLP